MNQIFTIHQKHKNLTLRKSCVKCFKIDSQVNTNLLAGETEWNELAIKLQKTAKEKQTTFRLQKISQITVRNSVKT